MAHPSEKHEKTRGKISLREILIILGLVGTSGVALSLNSKPAPKPTEQEHHLSIREIKALMRDFESQDAPYRP